MYSFKYDYSEGAHPAILEALAKSNNNQMYGYGDDCATMAAVGYIKREIKNDDAGVYLISGGTQTNLIAICAMLRPHEAVIAPATGHINVHETGAIEATGHKVVTALTDDGKLTPDIVEKVLNEHTDYHMVKPKMVYISNSTELGSIYKERELESLSDFCRANDMYLYMDGARLGTALMAEHNDLFLPRMAELCDAFYIGGTKNGSLIGEALVMCNPCFADLMPYIIKQRGGMLAKGRLLGIQFEELFRDGLYYELAAHANNMARKIAAAFKERGVAFLTPPVTNQIFPILPNNRIKRLEEDYDFYVWKDMGGGESAIRLVTSWATKKESVDKFIECFVNAIE